MLLNVHISGLDQATAKVKYITTAARQGLKFGVGEAALLFETAAKEFVPVKTGRLRDAIHTETVTDEAEKQVLQVLPFVPAANKWGFDPPYARRIENGFSGTDSLGRTYNQAAQPYMRPAFDTKRTEAEAAIRDNVEESVFEAFGKVAAKYRSYTAV